MYRHHLCIRQFYSHNKICMSACMHSRRYVPRQGVESRGVTRGITPRKHNAEKNVLRDRLVRRSYMIGVVLVLAMLATWAAIHPNTSVERAPERDFSAAITAASNDPLILAALKTRANQDRVVGGDEAAVSEFATTQPIGALSALPSSGDPVKGTFSPVINWPLVGIHAVLTPDGRVLSYGTSASGARSSAWAAAHIRCCPTRPRSTCSAMPSFSCPMATLRCGAATCSARPRARHY